MSSSPTTCTHRLDRRRARQTLLACVAITLGVTACHAPVTSAAQRPLLARTVGDRAPVLPEHGTDADEDGRLPDGVTVLDDGYPALTRLDPRLLTALRRAAIRAKQDGVALVVNSGWRSTAYQGELLREAHEKYGTTGDSARWVATPATSAHVRGDAVDVGTDAATWLQRHGAAYGLCPVYANEPWHYELRPDARDHGCPDLYADASHDPRTQQ